MLLAKKCLDTKSLRCLDAHSSSPFPTLNCAPKNNNNNKTTTKIGESRTPNINVQFPVLKLVWTLHKWQNCSTQFFCNFTLRKKKMNTNKFETMKYSIHNLNLISKLVQIVCMKTQNSNRSAPHAILKCSVKKLKQLKDPCVIYNF